MDTNTGIYTGGLVGLVIISTLFNIWWSVKKAATSEKRIGDLEKTVASLATRQDHNNLDQRVPTFNRTPDINNSFSYESQNYNEFPPVSPGNLTDEQYRQITNLLPNHKIEAIKLYRQFTQADLRTAKDAVDAMGNKNS